MVNLWMMEFVQHALLDLFPTVIEKPAKLALQEKCLIKMGWSVYLVAILMKLLNWVNVKPAHLHILRTILEKNVWNATFRKFLRQEIVSPAQHVKVCIDYGHSVSYTLFKNSLLGAIHKLFTLTRFWLFLITYILHFVDIFYDMKFIS